MLGFMVLNAKTKAIFLYIVMAVVLLSCNNNGSGAPVKSGYDTLINITNPGAGSAADDTVKINDTMPQEKE